MNDCDGFIEAMRAAGLTPHDPQELAAMSDAPLRRFRVEGDKSGSRNGWAVLHSHPTPAGAFGSWRTGEQHTWHAARRAPVNAADRAAWRLQTQQLHQAREIERARVQAAAQERAANLLRISRPATNDHPYLTRKGVPAFGIRQLGPALMVPARDSAGALHSLQFIQPDGTKTFLTGGRVKGCYHAIGRPGSVVLLAEGLATASTLRMATGEASAVCFSAGNLLPVALALRAKFPALRLVIVADNDAGTPGNPGVREATAAARAVGGYLAVPVFQGHDR